MQLSPRQYPAAFDGRKIHRQRPDGDLTMTTALWCVLVAGLLPYAATLAAKGGRRFDNREPRAWLAAQTGWRARANAAQLNGFEAFPLFAVAVLVAHAARAPQARVDLLALVFVAARIGYLVAYIADRDWLRSMLWFVGIASAVAIFVAGR
jgi:uncharacterized MAPEG superfamily protein